MFPEPLKPPKVKETGLTLESKEMLAEVETTTVFPCKAPPLARFNVPPLTVAGPENVLAAESVKTFEPSLVRPMLPAIAP